MYLVKKQLHDISNDPVTDVVQGLISVVVPVHSPRAEALMAALEAVANQSYEQKEIIVVNNGITDRSVFSGLSRLNCSCRVLDFDKNLGASFARNAGALASRGEFIWFVDSDVTSIPRDCAAYAVDVLRENPAIGAIGGIRLGTADRARFAVGRVTFPDPARQPSDRQLVEDTYVNTACVVLPRTVFFKAEGFTEYIEYLHDDNDFGFKIIAAGYRCVGCLQCAALHAVRTGGNSFFYEFMAFKNTLLYLFVNYSWSGFKKLLDVKEEHPDVCNEPPSARKGRNVPDTVNKLFARLVCLLYLGAHVVSVVRHRIVRQSFLSRLQTQRGGA